MTKGKLSCEDTLLPEVKLGLSFARISPARLVWILTGKFTLSEHDIETTVVHFLEFCSSVLAERGMDWRRVRQNIERLHNDLVKDAPNHPALARLRAYVSEQDARHRQQRSGNVDTIDGRVGAKVRVRRLELGMTQAALASKLGVSTARLRKHEQGAIRIDAAMLLRISRILRVSPQYFFGDET